MPTTEVGTRSLADGARAWSSCSRTGTSLGSLGAVRAKNYIELLTEHSILISISRRGNPYVNAQAESFINAEIRGGLSHRVSRFCWRAAPIGKFIDSVYNEKRLHSAWLFAAGRVRAATVSV